MQPFDSRGFKGTQSSCSLMCQDNRQWIFYKSSIWKPIKLSCGNDGPSLLPAGLLSEKLAFDATPIELCARKCYIMNHINVKIKRFYPHFWSRCCFKSLSRDRAVHPTASCFRFLNRSLKSCQSNSASQKIWMNLLSTWSQYATTGQKTRTP